MDNSLPHINWEELDEEYTAGGVLRILHDGFPFTGIAVEISEHKTIISQESYVDGFLDGVSNEWFEDGNRCATSMYKWNRLHGKSQEWFESGTLKRESIYELGILVSEQEWNERSDIIDSYTIEHDIKQQATLAQTRDFFQRYNLLR